MMAFKTGDKVIGRLTDVRGWEKKIKKQRLKSKNKREDGFRHK
jgi:hypothetical protein